MGKYQLRLGRPRPSVSVWVAQARLWCIAFDDKYKKQANKQG